MLLLSPHTFLFHLKSQTTLNRYCRECCASLENTRKPIKAQGNIVKKKDFVVVEREMLQEIEGVFREEKEGVIWENCVHGGSRDS